LKNIATILLLGLLLFNWVGYRLFTSFLEARANASLDSRVDKLDYDESQLLSVKVPVSHLPYYSVSLQYERANGRVEINGVSYSFVKQRLFNDSLELLCIPNHQATQWKKASSEFFKSLNDLSSGGQTKKTDSHKGNSKNFSSESYNSRMGFDLASVSSAVTPSFPLFSESACSLISLTAERPPDYLA
jgi:hypothetical protein